MIMNSEYAGIWVLAYVEGLRKPLENVRILSLTARILIVYALNMEINANNYT